ncbi:Uncharacterised protein [Vibrio cholerae]|nr:Uncharacterised protein [Vibrio cholerae]
MKPSINIFDWATIISTEPSGAALGVYGLGKPPLL